MIWHDPIYLFLLIPTLMVLLWRFASRKKSNPTLQFSNLQNLLKVPASLRVRLLDLPWFLKSISLLLIVVALARPQTADNKIKKNIEGIDIMIALDISDSMLIEDMKPTNRIEAAKDTIRRFIKNRNNDRIGLIIFAGEAFT